MRRVKHAGQQTWDPHILATIKRRFLHNSQITSGTKVGTFSWEDTGWDVPINIDVHLRLVRV
jgi:hypothetical protein